MQNFIISVDAACDLDEKILKENNISVAPMKMLIGNDEYFTAKNDYLQNSKICKKMQEGIRTLTSQMSPLEVSDYLTNLLKEKKDILHISFTSAMSETYNNFKKVSEELNKSHDNKVYVVDSLCQAGGISLLVLMLLEELKTKNLNLTDAIKFLEENKLKIEHIFTVDNLKYLVNGGRISKTAAIIGNVISLKPIMYLNDKGKIVAKKKVVGRKKAITEIVDNVIKNYNGLSKYVVISSAGCEFEAMELAKEIERKLDVKVIFLPLSLIITCHSGPGTISVYYTVDERK